MKRKTPALPATTVPEPLISPEILAEAKRSVGVFTPDPVPATAKCSVCGSEATPNPVEQLCWVCRRLKISAWREVETQVPVQE